MISKPKRPYKNFASYCESVRLMCSEEQRVDVDHLPCRKCHGNGRYFNVQDRDVNEGYRHALTCPCDKCDGTGRGTRAEHLAVYRMRLKQYTEELRHWRERKVIVDAALSKLTKQEREALGL